MRIREAIRNKIRGSKRLKGLLAADHEVTTKTVENWCDGDNKRLVDPSSLKIIRRELELTDEEIFPQKLLA